MTTLPKYRPHSLGAAVGKLVEECGELQAALGKTMRWGWDSVNPEIPKKEQETNEEWVRREIEDVQEAAGMLLEFLATRKAGS